MIQCAPRRSDFFDDLLGRLSPDKGIGVAVGPAVGEKGVGPILADLLNSIGQTGMAVAAIIGLILDNPIPGTPRERGLE